MSIYSRYKRDPEGFRKLVELLESTPEIRRVKMIEAGMNEDPTYTQDALKFMLKFDDIIQMPPLEKAEVVHKAPAKSMAYALLNLPKEVQDRFLAQAQGSKGSEIKGHLDDKGSPFEISGARVKIITVARELERLGTIRTKAIPKK